MIVQHLLWFRRSNNFTSYRINLLIFFLQFFKKVGFIEKNSVVWGEKTATKRVVFLKYVAGGFKLGPVSVDLDYNKVFF